MSAANSSVSPGAFYSSSRRRRWFLLGKERLQCKADFRDVDGGDLPNNAEVHIRVVVGDDVAHPSHLSERQCGNFAAGFVAQVGCGFSDNFDAPDHGILFLRIGPKLRL